jgi:CRP/FNR family cyclic AMP-dependent transcriptional regulator
MPYSPASLPFRTRHAANERPLCSSRGPPYYRSSMAAQDSNGRPRSEPSARRLSLARAAPDLGAALPADRQFVLDQVSIPVVNIGEDSTSVSELLQRFGAFAAIVVEGLVLHDLAIGAEPGVRILGPGDLIAVPAEPGPTLLERSTYRATPATQLALLGNDFLNAARHEPRLLAGVQAVAAVQTERLSAQLVICQMPRVADRVLTMLWLLAETFGRVTPAGIRLRLSLTHELVGAMVGARRPTVTLALGELSKRGAVVHQDGSWLLLEPPPTAGPTAARAPDRPVLLDREPAAPAAQPYSADQRVAPLEALEATVRRLHEDHQDSVVRVRERLRRFARSRERSSQVLAQIRATQGALRAKPPPSSG